MNVPFRVGRFSVVRLVRGEMNRSDVGVREISATSGDSNGQGADEVEVAQEAPQLAGVSGLRSIFPGLAQKLVDIEEKVAEDSMLDCGPTHVPLMGLIAQPPTLLCQKHLQRFRLHNLRNEDTKATSMSSQFSRCNQSESGDLYLGVEEDITA